MNSSEPPPTPTSPSSNPSEPCWLPENVMVTPRRPRISAPKVKTGCKTCKIRRVKCDEEKPSCRRCLRFHGECDGYEVDLIRSSSKSLKPKSLASIAPKITNTCIPGPLLPIAIFTDVWPRSGDDDPEQSYFQHFQENTLYRCSEYLDESLWERLVFPACQSEPSIRHTVIAIGALDKSLEKPNPAQTVANAWTSQKQGSRNRLTSHYQFAMHYYDKAVDDMREAISNHCWDIKNTLMTSLLFVCFEKLHGNLHMALDNAHSGLKIVHGWLQQLVELGIIHTTYSTDSRSSSPCAIEDELINAFARLGIVTKLLEKDEPVKSHGPQRPTILEICQFMPQTFLSVEEAKMYWDLMWRQTLQYLASTKTWSLVLVLEDFDHVRRDELRDESLQDNRIKSYEQDGDYLNGLLQWSSAFEQLFVDSQSFANQKDYTAATSLAVQSKAYYLAVAAGFCGEMYYDHQLRTCKEILSLAETFMLYIKDRGYLNQATFCFEQIITRSIYMVARMCRDRGTRRKAISLLRSTPQREDSWDNLLMARIATISMEIEEQKMEGQFVPERARIKTIKTTFNMQAHTGKLFYVKAKPDPGWEGVVEEAAFTW